jgi:hypothetical protein
VSDTPRTDAVWEKFGTDLRGELEPDVEFSTLARQLLNLTDRIKRLEEALDKTTKIASKHIKQLEEAGDAVAAIIGPPGSAHWADENQVDAAWNNWTKAKEAK